MILAALAYSKLNWHVVPVEPNSKRPPLVNSGILDASSNASQIESWWGRTPNANIALRTGLGWMALDVDIRNGGNESLEALERIYGQLTTTVTQRTASGGRHILYRVGQGRKFKGTLGPGIDVKHTNGYILASPSVVDGGSYRWEYSPWETPMADLPSWVENLLTVEETAPLTNNGSTAKLERAYAYMRATPGAISGQEGSKVTFNLARKLVREFELDDVSAMAVMSEYNQRCEPVWSQPELIRKVNQARKSRK